MDEVRWHVNRLLVLIVGRVAIELRLTTFVSAAALLYPGGKTC